MIEVLQVLLVIFSVYLFNEKMKEKFCILGAVGDCSITNTTTNETVVNAISEVVASNASNCTASGGVTQTLSISGIKSGGDIVISGVDQTADVQMNFTCMQNQDNQAQLLNDIQQKVVAELQQKTSGYNFQPVEQTNVNNQITNISNSINMSQLSECVSNQFTSQEQIYANLEAVGDIKISDIGQAATFVSTNDCIQKQTNVKDAITTLDNTIKAKQTQEAKGIDIIGDIFGAYTTVIIGVIVCVVCMSLISAIASVALGTSPQAGQNMQQFAQIAQQFRPPMGMPYQQYLV